MKTFYMACLSLLFISCGRVYYTGSSYSKTEQVDVYVTEGSIERPFKFIGKGYVGMGPATPEQIQKRSVKKARQKGADAILINDYLLPPTSTEMRSIYRTDSVGRGLITVGNSTITAAPTSRFEIYFIKYK